MIRPSLGVKTLCCAKFFQEETVIAMELVLSEAKAKRLKQSRYLCGCSKRRLLRRPPEKTNRVLFSH
jgi:hypothetical protein